MNKDGRFLPIGSMLLIGRYMRTRMIYRTHLQDNCQKGGMENSGRRRKQDRKKGDYLLQIDYAEGENEWDE